MMLSLLDETSETTKRPKSATLSPLRVANAAMCWRPNFITSSRARGAKLKGLKYEASVKLWLDKELDGAWEKFPGQWLSYTDGQRMARYCQPDFFAVNFDTWTVLVVEIKLTRVSKAWWQLNGLYMPVLKNIFSAFDFACLEIASKIVPVDVPEKVRVIHRLSDFRRGHTSFMKVPYLDKIL